jgi:hypothetical protein
MLNVWVDNKIEGLSAATDKILGANAVDASFPHRISSSEVSVTGPWLSASDRFLTASYLESKKVWEKEHTLLPSCLSRATINQGIEVVVGMSHRDRGQKNSEKLHAGRY